jgi:hypothetical protein
MSTGKFVILILFTGVMLSCKKTSTSELYTPTEADVTTIATLKELQEGRTLYINNCGSCHDFYSPDDLSITQWKMALAVMVTKTTLTSQQVILVTKYVTRGKL